MTAIISLFFVSGETLQPLPWKNERLSTEGTFPLREGKIFKALKMGRESRRGYRQAQHLVPHGSQSP